MAFPVWRRAKQLVYVYYHDSNTGLLRQVERTLTKHLDGQPPEEVKKWIEDWEQKHGKSVNRAKRIHLGDGDKLTGLWKQYQAHRRAIRKRRPETEKAEGAQFHTYIVGFFVGTHQRKDPAAWHELVPSFHAHLFAHPDKLKDSTIKEILWTLERFGKYLVFQRYTPFPYVIQVPSRENSKVTPLKVRKSPDEILKFIKNNELTFRGIDFKLAILLGYFAALRPSELFALERDDLLAGRAAEDLTKTLKGFRDEGLGSRLSVSVTKTLDAKGVHELTKTSKSCGVVNIWNVEAAKLIASIVKERAPGRLFPFSDSKLHKCWRRFLTKKEFRTTAHDLRRASGLYLGRELRIAVTLLQDHMRHEEIETTMLYTREPAGVEKTRKYKQDFDDVA